MRDVIAPAAFAILMLSLAAAIANAQVGVELSGGGTMLFSGTYEGFVPTLAVGVFDEGSRLGGEVSFDFPRTYTTRERGFLRSGPVVYVFTERTWIASFVVRGEALKRRRVGIKYVAGLGRYHNVATSQYEGLHSEPRRFDSMRPTWSAGLELRTRAGPFAVAAPHMRVHRVLGPYGYAVWTIGATAGWSTRK